MLGQFNIEKLIRFIEANNRSQFASNSITLIILLSIRSWDSYENLNRYNMPYENVA